MVDLKSCIHDWFSCIFLEIMIEDACMGVINVDVPVLIGTTPLPCVDKVTIGAAFLLHLLLDQQAVQD